MAFKISLSETEGIWQVIFNGEINARERQAAVEEGLRLTKDHYLKGILVDFRNAELDMSIREEYDLGVTVTNSPKFKGVRVAFLENSKQEALNQFLQLVEANRGQSTRIFINRKNAMKWLSDAVTSKSPLNTY